MTKDYYLVTIDRTKIIEFYVTHRNYFNKGMSEIDQVRRVVQAGAIVGAAMKLFGTSTKFVIYFTIILSILTIFFCWCLGRYWDKIKAYHVEQEWGNRRNPFVKTVEERLNVSNK